MDIHVVLKTMGPRLILDLIFRGTKKRTPILGTPPCGFGGLLLILKMTFPSTPPPPFSHSVSYSPKLMKGGYTGDDKVRRLCAAAFATSYRGVFLVLRQHCI